MYKRFFFLQKKGIADSGMCERERKRKNAQYKQKKTNQPTDQQTELKHEQKHHLELWHCDFIGNEIINSERAHTIDWQTM